MERLDRTAVAALRHVLARQPLSDAKVVCAWQIAAGPTLARAARVTWGPDGTLLVTARSDAWRRELSRSRAVVLARMAELLGGEVVRSMTVVSDDGRPALSARARS